MFFTSIKNKIKSFESALFNLESSVKINTSSLELRIIALEGHIQSEADKIAKAAADREAALVAKSTPYISGLKDKIEAIKQAFVAEVAHSETVAGTAITDVKELVSLVTKGL